MYSWKEERITLLQTPFTDPLTNRKFILLHQLLP